MSKPKYCPRLALLNISNELQLFCCDIVNQIEGLESQLEYNKTCYQCCSVVCKSFQPSRILWLDIAMLLANLFKTLWACDNEGKQTCKNKVQHI